VQSRVALAAFLPDLVYWRSQAWAQLSPQVGWQQRRQVQLLVQSSEQQQAVLLAL
jgi:hypothetical protein